MKKKLGELCQVVSGTTPKTGIPEYWGGSAKWITPAELDDDSYIVEDSARKITELGIRKTGLSPFPAGTVLLTSRAPIGKVAIAGCEMYCNQGFKNLVCSERIHNKFLYWFLKSKTAYLNSLGRGATFKEISKDIVEQIEIEVPSLEKQKAVAMVLETIRHILLLRRAQLAALDELVKARFVEMFGDPVRNPQNWPKHFLADEAEIKIGPFGSLLHKDEYVADGHALVNPSHIVDGRIMAEPDFTVSDEKYAELSSYHLQVGDIVLGRRGEMGRCAVVEQSGLLCGTGSLFIRSKGNIAPDFIQKIISFPSFRRTIEDMAVGQTMLNLNVPIVSSFQIIVPPKRIQTQYYAFVEQVFKVKAVILYSLAKTQTLFDSLMQEYFSPVMSAL